MSTNHTSLANKPGPRTRRHPQVNPEVLALLHRAQHGDRDAFADLYRTFHDAVTRYIAVRMRDRDRDAIPDLVQDAFTGALEELPHALLDVRGWFIIQAAKARTRHDWSRRRYTRAAYTLHEHARRHATASTGFAEPQRRPGRVTFVHAMARLTPDQR
ncbi:RNA polymerase sigma factor, partial [Allorhizocola rhizosphaerae]|uniref:RNA polymerase sigma factor n=1 Tax=Allorhizocola rhizosphaerae TaxID=1872709 RepID=UPI001B8C4F26